MIVSKQLLDYKQQEVDQVQLNQQKKNIENFIK